MNRVGVLGSHGVAGVVYAVYSIESVVNADYRVVGTG